MGKKEEFFCAPQLIYFRFETRELELGEALALCACFFACVHLSLFPFLIQSRETVAQKRVQTLKLVPQDGQDKVTHIRLGLLLGEQTLGPKKLS